MRNFKRITVFLFCLTGIFSGFLTYADDITDLIQRGEKTYAEKHYKESIKSLHQAIQKMQDILAGELTSFLPGEIKNWKRGEVRDESIHNSSGGLMVFSSFYSASVEYRKENGPDRVAVTITNAPQMVQMAKIPFELLKNPYFQEMSKQEDSGEKVDAYGLNDIEGYRRTMAADKEAEIIIFLEDVMLQVQGRSLSDLNSIEQFVKEADLEGIKRFTSAN